ncbi:hypothetical protein BT69DRAFT_654598 [Atractiella rhizophila]|nr:hypothetical protein BT69DRAFT_654598 [Atractiella rhizophila]
MMKLHRPFCPFFKSSLRQHGYSKDQCISSASIVVRSVSELRETFSHVPHVYHHAFAATVVLLADMFESIENGVPPPILEEKRRTLLLAEDIFVPDRIPGQNLNHLVTQAATAIKMLLDSVQVKSSEDPGTSSRSNSNSYTSFVEVIKSARELQRAAAVTASCHLPPTAHLYHHPQPSYLRTHYSDSTKDFRELLTEDIKNTQATGGSVQTFEYILESEPFQQHDPVGVEGTQIPLTVPSSAAPVPLSDYHPQQQLTYAIQSPHNFPANPSHFIPLNPNQEQFARHTSDHDISPSVQVQSPYEHTNIIYDDAASARPHYKSEPFPHYMSRY